MKTHLQRQLLRAQAPESLADHLAEMLVGHRIECAIDVGANQGEYGEFLRGLGFEGSIVSFEPAKDAYERLAGTAAGDPRWTALNLAVGARREEVVLHVARDNVFSSLLPSRPFATGHFGEMAEPRRDETVEAVALGELGEHVESPPDESAALLKIDVQGFEHQVLAGLGGSFARPRLLQVEMGVEPLYDGAPGYLELLGEVVGRGYVPSGFFPVNRDEDGTLIELDAVFVAT